MPLSRLVDLPRVNEVLRQVLRPPATRRQVALRLARQLPRLAKLGAASLLGGGERGARGRLLAGGLRSVLGSSAIEGSPLLSVIIGTFHTGENVDLAFQRTCNLYSHLRVGSEQRLLPACTRQIVVERSLAARDLDVDATVAAIQRELGPCDEGSAL